MVEYIIKDVIVKADDRISEEEAAAYVNRERIMHKYANVHSLELHIPADDPEDVEITVKFDPIPFERIRRITGYLVGTLDRFNDGKKSEESDRVKHDIS